MEELKVLLARLDVRPPEEYQTDEGSSMTQSKLRDSLKKYSPFICRKVESLSDREICVLSEWLQYGQAKVQSICSLVKNYLIQHGRMLYAAIEDL